MWSRKKRCKGMNPAKTKFVILVFLCCRELGKNYTELSLGEVIAPATSKADVGGWVVVLAWMKISEKRQPEGRRLLVLKNVLWAWHASDVDIRVLVNWRYNFCPKYNSFSVFSEYMSVGNSHIQKVKLVKDPSLSIHQFTFTMLRPGVHRRSQWWNCHLNWDVSTAQYKIRVFCFLIPL